MSDDVPADLSTPPAEPMCLVCGLNPGRYPNHWLMHGRLAATTPFEPNRVAFVESINLTLRIELRLPPGSAGAGAGAWSTLPADLTPGVGAGDDDDDGDRP